MKKTTFLFTIIFCFQLSVFTQTFLLTVNNGYGSGSYAAGDTVHIWAKEFAANSVYDKWTGDTATVAMPDEWHTTLVMPGANITLNANFKTVAPYTIILDTIQGKVIAKPVYYYFPTNYYGVIYFFHGTGGKAIGWINNIENQQMVTQAIGENFAVIITEADEATTGVDANSDGKLRWKTFPLDSVNNVDYANIKIITDTLINRGLMTHNTKRFSIGMSNGGSYSSGCSALFGFDAGISYCASGASALFDVSTVPFQFCMAKYDLNAEVGAAGNADALANSNKLIARDICSRYYLHDRSPVYPERLKRITNVTTNQSQNVFNDLVNNNMLDGGNYLIVTPDTLVQRYTANPSLFPGINALTGGQKAEAVNAIAACYADHQFYSDYNALSLKFLRNPCDSTNALPTTIDNVAAEKSIAVYPNPAQQNFIVELPQQNFLLEITDVAGRKIYAEQNILGKKQVDCSGFSNGVYFIRATNGKNVYSQKVIIGN